MENKSAESEPLNSNQETVAYGTRFEKNGGPTRLTKRVFHPKLVTECAKSVNETSVLCVWSDHNSLIRMQRQRLSPLVKLMRGESASTVGIMGLIVIVDVNFLYEAWMLSENGRWSYSGFR